MNDKTSNFSTDVLYDANHDLIPNKNIVSDFPVETTTNDVCNYVYSLTGDI